MWWCWRSIWCRRSGAGVGACTADAAHRGIEPPTGAPLLVALFALVGIPYYYFRILPPLRATAHAAAALVVLVFLLELTPIAQWLALKAFAI